MATILIANADHRYARILGDLLSRYGHEVVTARTGEEALQQFEARPPAVVLLDLMILGLHGIEVLARLRAQAPHLPVIVLGADVPPDVESRAREMGVSDVLRKRLKMDVIVQTVHRALQHAGRPVTPTPVPAAPPAAQPALILVVDDEPEICALVGEFLRRRGYRTAAAHSGEEALAAIAKDLPNLVLLDIYMPGMNGVELLRRIRTMYPSLGVIMLTASQDEPLLKTALDLGAFDVLAKPVDLYQLETAVMAKLLLSAPD
ncbi:response regulator [Nitrospira sp. Kam-Ns4a]